MQTKGFPIAVAAIFSLLFNLPVQSSEANRLAHLDEPNNPWQVNIRSAKLITPQWIGEEGIQGVAVLAIDDMSGDGQNFRDYLTPIIERLKHYSCNVNITDSWAIPEDAKDIYGIELQKIDNITNQDAIIIAVAHDSYKNLSLEFWGKILNENGLIIDIKSIYKDNNLILNRFKYWSL